MLTNNKVVKEDKKLDKIKKDEVKKPKIKPEIKQKSEVKKKEVKKPEVKKKKKEVVAEVVLPNLNLKTETVLNLFEDVDYDLKKVRFEKTVKPIYFTQFSRDLDEIQKMSNSKRRPS